MQTDQAGSGRSRGRLYPRRHHDHRARLRRPADGIGQHPAGVPAAKAQVDHRRTVRHRAVNPCGNIAVEECASIQRRIIGVARRAAARLVGPECQDGRAISDAHNPAVVACGSGNHGNIGAVIIVRIDPARAGNIGRGGIDPPGEFRAVDIDARVDHRNLGAGAGDALAPRCNCPVELGPGRPAKFRRVEGRRGRRGSRGGSGCGCGSGRR